MILPLFLAFISSISFAKLLPPSFWPLNSTFHLTQEQYFPVSVKQYFQANTKKYFANQYFPSYSHKQLHKIFKKYNCVTSPQTIHRY